MRIIRTVAWLAASGAFGFVASCGRSSIEADAAKAIAGMNMPADPQFPAFNAEMLLALSADVPALRSRLPALESAERANLARAATLIRAWAKEGEPAKPAARARAVLPAMPHRRAAAFDPGGWLVPSAQAQNLETVVTMISGYSSGALLGSMVGRGSGGEVGSETRSIDGPGGEKISVTRDANADGTMTVSLESNVDVLPLGIVSGTKTSLSSKSLCPDANGRVEFTVKTSQRAAATGLGALAQQSGTLEAIVEVTVNESAEIASTVIQTKYDRKSNGADGASTASGSADWKTLASNVEMTRQTSGAVSGTSGSAHENSAATAAVVLGRAAASGAALYWQHNNCIRIDADVPYRPKPGATKDIAVKVIHKVDGSAVPARVDAKLSGGQSLTPVVIRRAPGTLVHVAPNKAGAQTGLELRARSRRGAAIEQYSWWTAESCYNIDGGGGEFVGQGSTCDLTQPFTVEGNAEIRVDFTPTDAKGGTYSYTGRVMGAKLAGKGTYTVQYNGAMPVGITATGPGTAFTPKGNFTTTDTEKYVLTPQD